MTDITPKWNELQTKNPAFAAVLEQIIDTNLKKMADYTFGGDPFSNFKETAATAGTTPEMVLETMIALKCARLKALRTENKKAQNESVFDSKLDRAVYSIIACAWEDG